MEITAHDIMSDHVVVIYEDMLIRQVAHLMLRDRVSVFPVVNQNVGLVGIVTITDLFIIIDRAFNQGGKEHFEKSIADFKDLKVEEIMSRNVVTISPQTSLSEIVHMLVTKGIHAFPVIDDGKLIGIVSRHDILNAIYAFD